MTPATLIEHSRRAAGLSQAALAERSGTSQPTISAYESGRKDPSAATLARILAATGRRLTVVPGTVVRSPGQRELKRRGEILAQVIELAEALPARHTAELRYPPLRELVASASQRAA